MIKRRERGRFGTLEHKIQMTPMIDVTFQLLIFFILALDPMDLFSHLAGSRPGDDKNAPPNARLEDLARVNVWAGGYTVNGRAMTIRQVEKWLGELAKQQPDAPVLIICAGDSEHSRLVQVLDVCTDVGLHRLSIASR
jgi:biopolymer transport protein ExbD